MMAYVAGPQAPHAAPALRFLALCLGGWVVLRIMMSWNPGVPVMPHAARPPAGAPPPVAIVSRPIGLASVADRHSAKAPSTAPRDRGFSDARDAEIVGTVADLGADRHALRFALAASVLPPGVAAGEYAGAARRGEGATWFPVPAAVGASPARGAPFWLQRDMAGWSLGGWLYLRDGSAVALDGIAAASHLGASQGGVRLAYGFGETGRLRAYARATAAISRPQQRELAFGLAFAPAPRWPVDIAVERRVAAGREGRTALAAMVTGGVGGMVLPGDFRLEAYGQAGVVGARQRDVFADGAVVVDRRLGANEDSGLRFGALAAGAVQPGAARVDVGPRLTLRLPKVGEGSRIAIDWRQRIAGDATPESGVALTLASDF